MSTYTDLIKKQKKLRALVVSYNAQLGELKETLKTVGEIEPTECDHLINGKPAFKLDRICSKCKLSLSVPLATIVDGFARDLPRYLARYHTEELATEELSKSAAYFQDRYAYKYAPEFRKRCWNLGK